MSDIGDRVIELHQRGVRAIDIAHRLNVAQATVHYHLRSDAERTRLPQQATKMARAKATRAHTLVETKERVAELLDQGVSRIEIARRLGIAKSTVSYHARRLGAPIEVKFRRRYDWAIVQEFYEQGHSVRACCEAFGFSTGTWQSAARRGLVTPRPGYKPVEEIFAANTRRNRGHLKQRLLRLGIKDGSCERCGLKQWRGEAISMALHHINADRLDNRIENLELLCPNCHSQTESYGGRNGHRCFT
jgi:DNA-binding CsgD family transcriptional regulator